MKSPLWRLNLDDWTKGLVIAVVMAALTVLYEALQKGGFAAINWNLVLTAAVGAAITYLIKNLATGQGDKLLTDKPKGEK